MIRIPYPTRGIRKNPVTLTAEQLVQALFDFKSSLVQKGEATGLFGQEVQKGVIAGIVGNVMQSFDDNDLYPTLEEKAAHLLYFMVKNHPFTGGNKRSGAYAFIWFLQKAGILDRSSLTALTALTLLLCAILPRHATTERIGRNKNKFAYYMFAYYIYTDNFVKQII